MKLTKEEQEILDGKQGAVKQQAMKTLVAYGEGLGADRLLDVDDVTTCVNCPYPNDFLAGIEFNDIAELFSWTSLGTTLEGAFHDIPRVSASRCATVCGLNITEEYIDYLGISGEKAEKMKKGVRDMHEFMQKVGINDTFCCAPQILGHFPLKGEHTVTGESSQVVFQNSVMGARCNCEGMVVHGCAAMLGKIPNTGYHITENRWGTHLIKVECIPQDVLDWDILGYWIGKKVGVGVPVIDVDVPSVSPDAHKSLGAAICSGGQVDMYHILGLTPEAGTLDMAFGKNTPKAIYTYTEKEREDTLKFLDFSTKKDVDMVILGCPQYSIYQVRDVARYLEGKQCEVRLVVQTPQMLIDQARKNGDAQIIEAAGGFLLADTCVPMCGLWPENIACVATDSVKNACYIPGDRPDIEIHMGTMERCLDAAVTGKWES